MLTIILRIILIVAASYWLSKIITNLIRATKNSHSNKDQNNNNQTHDTLDICPLCGNLKEKNHRCH